MHAQPVFEWGSHDVTSGFSKFPRHLLSLAGILLSPGSTIQYKNGVGHPNCVCALEHSHMSQVQGPGVISTCKNTERCPILNQTVNPPSSILSIQMDSRSRGSQVKGFLGMIRAGGFQPPKALHHLPSLSPDLMGPKPQTLWSEKSCRGRGEVLFTNWVSAAWEPHSYGSPSLYSWLKRDPWELGS